jgi:hypothetical protein
MSPIKGDVILAAFDAFWPRKELSPSDKREFAARFLGMLAMMGTG